jgi:hypothetical protein
MHIHTYIHACIHTYMKTWYFRCRWWRVCRTGSRGGRAGSRILICMYVCMYVCLHVRGWTGGLDRTVTVTERGLGLVVHLPSLDVAKINIPWPWPWPPGRGFNMSRQMPSCCLQPKLQPSTRPWYVAKINSPWPWPWPHGPHRPHQLLNLVLWIG